jgi:SAM-dependent methyltransferase
MEGSSRSHGAKNRVLDRAYFISGYYSDTLDRPSGKYAKTADFFRKRGVKKVLDLGCGVGRHSVLLARDGFEVYGFDYSRSAVKETKKLLRNNSLNAKILVYDMDRRFPYKDSFFDAVFASRTIYQTKIDRIKKRLSEVRRVLKDGGYLYWEGPTYKATYYTAEGEKRIEVEPGTTLSVGGVFAGTYYHRFRSKEELRTLLTGFKILRFDFRGRTYKLLCQKTALAG